MRALLIAGFCLLLFVPGLSLSAFGEGLLAGTFDVDATPPVGSFLAYDEMVNSWDLGLRARGVVLLGAGEPIVVMAVDWIGISNESHDVFRDTLAGAAGTSRGRVAVHSVHQHDAPACDFSTEKILAEHGIAGGRHDGTFSRELLGRLEAAVKGALENARPVTHVGLGTAEVFEVASNRRILGDDGKVWATRFTACRDAELRAEPEGVIDPEVSLVSLWDGDEAVAVLSYYAVHPQSYYRTGVPNPDFPGVARFLRQMAVPGALHVHFTGAGGNIGAGKYNDGAPENRLVLAERLADGMRRAWENTVKTPVAAGDVGWRVEVVELPLADHVCADQLEAELRAGGSAAELGSKARQLAWARRCGEGNGIEISCLAVGGARILHMPGELFVEYQLAAKAARPDLVVAMAAYGDYGAGYIGTARAYEEGGYETSERATRTTPEVESVLMGAIERLLKD